MSLFDQDNFLTINTTMLQGHIKITLKCEETNEEIYIEIDGKESIVNVEIWDVVVPEKSELFSQSFVWLLETFGLTEKFMKELEESHWANATISITQITMENQANEIRIDEIIEDCVRIHTYAFLNDEETELMWDVIDSLKRLKSNR